MDVALPAEHAPLESPASLSGAEAPSVAPADARPARSPDLAANPGHVPAGSAAPISVAGLELITSAGWPGTEHRRLGDWVLRAGGGFTGRANSTLPVGSPGVPLDDAVRQVQDFYHSRGLGARFQIPCSASDSPAAEVDEWLAGAGWVWADPTLVLVGDLQTMLSACERSRVAHRPLPTVVLADSPSESWLDGYRHRGHALPAVAPDVLMAGDAPVFASMHQDSRRLGVARGVVTDGWLGATALEVEPEARRRGAATAIMGAIGAWAWERGARSVYLQVVAENAVALAMYAAWGFVEHHRYHYRIEPPARDR